ncbi:MAG: hypothetical protein R2882_08825 [Gemmatimonadales bacterium]
MGPFGYNIFKTWATWLTTYEELVIQAAALEPNYTEAPHPEMGGLTAFCGPPGTDSGERLPVTFTVMVTLAVVVASLRDHPDVPDQVERAGPSRRSAVYAAGTRLLRHLHPRGSVSTATPRMVRLFRFETERYGEFETGRVRLRPPLPSGVRAGSDRTSPGSAASTRTCGTSGTSTTPPEIDGLLDHAALSVAADEHARLRRDPEESRRHGHARRPLRRDAVNRAPEMAREQATQMAAGIAAQGGPADLADKEVIAITAYLQRLGKDIKLAQSGNPATLAGGGTR